jgi:hypothetical protein
MNEPEGKLLGMWRGRLIKASPDGALFMSKRHDPHGWDFTENTVDAAFAVQINVCDAMPLGEPVVSVRRVSDDVLRVTTTMGEYRIVGDPADGGSILPVTKE